MNRITATLLCLMLCLAGTGIMTASAATRLSTSSKTALTSCLQQEYLMRDTYQNIFAKYPTLTTFGAVATDEVAMIAALTKVFAKYKIAVPADAKVSAARTIANTATSISGADTVAINLEQSTATVMTQQLQSTDNRDVADAVALIKTTSLGSHTSAFAAEQTTVATPPTPPPTQRVVSLTTSDTKSTFLTLLANESVDVIEMAAGTYHLPYTIINIDRTRPVMVRPATGATVLFSGTDAGEWGQFDFGRDGTASNITMEGFTFDGYTLDQIGIIWIGNAHDITLNNMVVQNSHCNGTTATPDDSWALYLSYDASVEATNITANNWTVVASARGMSALQLRGNSHVTATGWLVSHAYYAVYTSTTGLALNTDFILDDWAISDTGNEDTNPCVAVRLKDSLGRFSNMHARASGVLLNVGTPTMTDGGGNSL